MHSNQLCKWTMTYISLSVAVYNYNISGIDWRLTHNDKLYETVSSLPNLSCPNGAKFRVLYDKKYTGLEKEHHRRLWRLWLISALLIKLKSRPEAWHASLSNKSKPDYVNIGGPTVLFLDYFWSINVEFAHEWRVHCAWVLKKLLN